MAAPRSLDNLVLLCRRHHRAVHEGGFDVAAGEAGVLEFWQPDGSRLREAPSACHEPLEIPAMDPPAPWDGTRFDLTYAIDVVWRSRAGRALTIAAESQIDSLSGSGMIPPQGAWRSIGTDDETRLR